MKKYFYISLFIPIIFSFQNCGKIGSNSVGQLDSSSSSVESPTVMDGVPNGPAAMPIASEEPKADPIVAEEPKKDIPVPIVNNPKILSVTLVNTQDNTDIIILKEGLTIETDKVQGEFYQVHAKVSDSQLVFFDLNGVQNDEVNPPFTSSVISLTESKSYNLKVIGHADSQKVGTASDPFLMKFSVKKVATAIGPDSTNKKLLFFWRV